METIKLKLVKVNNHFVLADETAEIKLGDTYIDEHQKIHICIHPYDHFIKDYREARGELGTKFYKIIFSDLELNLDVPVIPNWKLFEVKKLAIKRYGDDVNLFGGQRDGFIEGYNSNKAKYTEEDLRKAILEARNPDVHWKEIIESLEKYPKYIVVKSETKTGFLPKNLSEVDWDNKLKLILTPEGYQTGIIKELIW